MNSYIEFITHNNMFLESDLLSCYNNDDLINDPMFSPVMITLLPATYSIAVLNIPKYTEHIPC